MRLAEGFYENRSMGLQSAYHVAYTFATLCPHTLTVSYYDHDRVVV